MTLKIRGILPKEAQDAHIWADDDKVIRVGGEEVGKITKLNDDGTFEADIIDKTMEEMIKCGECKTMSMNPFGNYIKQKELIE